MNILIGCEESQAVANQFRSLGHAAFSCDILPCSGGHPEYHYQRDVFMVISDTPKCHQCSQPCMVDDNSYRCDLCERLWPLTFPYEKIVWDLGIFHPPCTFLTVTGNKWYYHPDDKHLSLDKRRPHPRFPNRKKDRDDAIKFFMSLWNSPIEKVCLENPVGIMSTHFRKPDQIIQPYQFGDEATKTTCLWIRNLPLLKETNIVGKGDRITYKSGKSHASWYAAAAAAKTKIERIRIRSKTFPGIANAMAVQWGKMKIKSSIDITNFLHLCGFEKLAPMSGVVEFCAKIPDGNFIDNTVYHYQINAEGLCEIESVDDKIIFSINIRRLVYSFE